MNFPKYWTKGHSGAFECWGWSSKSLQDAQALADAAAARLAERYEHNELPELTSWEYYPRRPFREEVLQEFRNGGTDPFAVITRNSFGCRVLNTARVMFVDIDFPAPPRASFFQRLVGKTPSDNSDAHEGSVMAKIETWTRGKSGWGWQAYRTRAGIRLIASHDVIEAASDTANEVLEALGSDPLYRQLCITQKCYRARLTPKPWRCGVSPSRVRWPWKDGNAEKRYKRWESNYVSRAFNWATCKFIGRIGNADVHPEVRAILDVHDSETKSRSDLKLA